MQEKLENTVNQLFHLNIVQTKFKRELFYVIRRVFMQVFH